MSKRRTVKFAASPSPPPRSHTSPLQRLTLNTGSWSIPATSTTPSTTLEPVPIPTTIHDALTQASIPYTSQWLSSHTWTFTTEFYVTVPAPTNLRVDLVFEGLDTFATVLLNGTQILRTENMFLSHRVNITDSMLYMGRQNTITILFDSALSRGSALLQAHGPRACHDGHPSRVYVRKAQYHYGLASQPPLLTCGPWKPIYVEIYSARLAHVQAVPEISHDLKTAVVQLRAEVVTAADEAGEEHDVRVSVTSPGGAEVFSVVLLPEKEGGYAGLIAIEEPELWWPRDQGDQNRYTVSYTLHAEDTVVHTVSQKLGLRTIQLDDSLPEHGSIRINNLPMPAHVAKWTPFANPTRETLKQQIHATADSTHNTLRVWGGGVYESEDFYDICDEEGILVRQDICLVDADYPAHLDEFVEEVVEEVEQNLARLRWHPSLVCVAGKAEEEGRGGEEEERGGEEEERGREEEERGREEEERGGEEDEGEETGTGRWLYEKRLPEIVASVCNGAADGEVAGVVYLR